jgi:hypothetical protein
MNEPTILIRLAAMAARLGLTSNQTILLYCGARNFLNMEQTQVVIGILQKLAEANKVILNEDEPYIIQLIQYGVFNPEESETLGFKVRPAETEPSNGAAASDVRRATS